MTSEEMAAIIRCEGTELTPEQVTPEYLQGMRRYREVYGYGDQLLSFMVRIDLARGANICACG